MHTKIIATNTINRLNDFTANRYGVNKSPFTTRLFEYYQNVDPEKIKAENKLIAEILLKNMTSAKSIYGLGFPYYGNVDVKKRLMNTFIENGNKQENTGRLAMKALPDVDLIVVFNSEMGPYRFSGNIFEEMNRAYSNAIKFDFRRLSPAFNSIQNEFRIAPPHTRAMEEFIKNDNIFMDLNPIPEHIWESLPFMFHLEDLTKFVYLRDLMFTCEKLAEVSYKFTNIPETYRENVVLGLIGENQELTEEEIINTIIENHPHKTVIDLFEETQSHVTNIFKEALKSLQELDMISLNNGKYSLTDNGKLKLMEYEAERNSILINGFPID